MQIRLAERNDIDRLIRMRWDFTLEDSSGMIGSGKTKLENACLCSLKFNEKGWLVEYYNESGHLKAL